MLLYKPVPIYHTIVKQQVTSIRIGDIVIHISLVALRQPQKSVHYESALS